jgi:MFS family permease
MTFLPWPLNAERARGVFLFLAVFPLLLALVAAPVFALQIALAAEGLRRRRGLAYGLLGALAGLAGSVVLSALFALAIGLLDVAAGRPVFLLAWILEGILVRPAEHAWLIPVLAAPLLPVIAHAAVALVNLPQAVPGAVRRALARFADREGVLRGTLSALGIGTLWSVPFLLAAILWWAALGFAGEAIASATWMWVTALRGVAVTAGFF